MCYKIIEKADRIRTLTELGESAEDEKLEEEAKLQAILVSAKFETRGDPNGRTLLHRLCTIDSLVRAAWKNVVNFFPPKDCWAFLQMRSVLLRTAPHVWRVMLLSSRHKLQNTIQVL